MNNGGFEERCEDSSVTGQAVCSCSILGESFSCDMKSCVAKKE